MRHYKLEITLLSAASAGSGEGWAGVIDSDVVFDRYGLPHIPGRRIKGVLRDMAEDVVNAYQLSTAGASAALQSTDVSALFGGQGQDHAAPLAVGNAYLQDQHTIIPWLKWAQENMPEIATPDRVLSTFTHVRAQTAIANLGEVKWLDPQAKTEELADGVADDGSLRLTRVLNADYTFVGDLTIDGDAEKHRHLLALAAQATRALGGKRNRGLGEVRCRLLEAASGENVIPAARAYLQKILTAPAPNENSAVESAAPEKKNPPAAANDGEPESATREQLNYVIRLKAPVLITGSVGDENMALSEDYLSGTSLLGFFANLYLKTTRLDKPAHEDENFKSWFLSNDLRFLNGYKMIEEKQGDDIIPRRTLPIPKSIQFKKTAEKTGSEEPLEKIFRLPAENKAPDADRNQEEETKAREGYCLLTGRVFEKVSIGVFEQATVEKHHHFHHQRTDQVLGRSDAGEIFNYEHLNAGQEFMAAITGNGAALKKFEQWLVAKIFAGGNRILTGRLGRSKNTQYGLVELDFSIAGEPAEVHAPDQFDALDKNDPQITLTLLSHAILLNEYGQAAVEEKWLLQALAAALTKNGAPIAAAELEIENRFVRAAGVENYVAVWKARKPSVFALEMGSCFLIRIKGHFGETKSQQLKTVLRMVEREGIGIRRNEGFGRVAINWQQKREKLNNMTKERNDARKELLKKNAPGGDLPAPVKKIFAAALQDYCEQTVRKLAVKKLEEFPATLSGSQIGRLQRFAETARDETRFKELLKALAKPAREGLEKNRSSQTTLLEFLESDHLVTENGELYKALIKAAAKHQTFFATAGYDPLANDKKAEWFKIYMTTFFAMMSKKAKSAKKEGQTHEQN